MTEADVVAMVDAAQNVADFQNACATIKSAFGGNFPPFWYSAIILSGKVNRFFPVTTKIISNF